MSTFAQQRFDACERLRIGVAVACLFDEKSEFSRKELSRSSNWESVPERSTKGRISTRSGKIVSVYVPVPEFHEYARKLGIKHWLISKGFKTKNVRLIPGGKQVWCYEVSLDTRGIRYDN